MLRVFTVTNCNGHIFSAKKKYCKFGIGTVKEIFGTIIAQSH